MMEDFEKDIKDFFQRREIKPSADAWQRMENLLNKPQAKPKKTYRIYWAVAASVIVLFGLFTLLQKQDKELIIDPASNDVYVTKDAVINKIQQPQNNNQVVKADIVPQKTENSRKQSTTIKSVLTEIAQNNKNQPKEKEVGERIEGQHIIQKSHREIEEKLLAQESKIEIKVNPSKLLRSAEMERQTDNMISNGQNFWKKVKEINTVVVHSK